VTADDIERDRHNRDDDLSRAARTLHREWETPELWPSIAARIAEQDAADIAARSWHSRLRADGRWQALAAAAVIALTLGPSSWLGWRWIMLAPRANETVVSESERQRLLTEEALAAIEQSETQYVNAIAELTRLAAPRLDMPDSPLLVNLRERLTVIDATIIEYRAEIARNRFNAHLRRQLLWIYQEKRRTLELIQEYDPDAL
jgi:hypothetical protein